MTGPVRQLPLELTHPSLMQSDNLVVTDSNRSAFKLIEQWPQWLQPIAVLVGPRGAGKTHFTQAWAEAAGALPIMLNDLEKALDIVTDGKPIYLEDIGETTINETALFHLMNAVKQASTNSKTSSLLMTSTTVPINWSVGLNDLASRLNSVTLAQIGQPDDDLLTAVAFKLFADRQVNVDLNLVSYLVSRVERSLYDLNLVVSEIDRLALQHKSKINKAIITQALSSFDEPKQI